MTIRYWVSDRQDCMDEIRFLRAEIRMAREDERKQRSLKNAYKEVNYDLRQRIAKEDKNEIL